MKSKWTTAKGHDLDLTRPTAVPVTRAQSALAQQHRDPRTGLFGRLPSLSLFRVVWAEPRDVAEGPCPRPGRWGQMRRAGLSPAHPRTAWDTDGPLLSLPPRFKEEERNCPASLGTGRSRALVERTELGLASYNGEHRDGAWAQKRWLLGDCRGQRIGVGRTWVPLSLGLY